jgi:hypothetical protein
MAKTGRIAAPTFCPSPGNQNPDRRIKAPSRCHVRTNACLAARSRRSLGRPPALRSRAGSCGTRSKSLRGHRRVPRSRRSAAIDFWPRRRHECRCRRAPRRGDAGAYIATSPIAGSVPVALGSAAYPPRPGLDGIAAKGVAGVPRTDLEDEARSLREAASPAVIVARRANLDSREGDAARLDGQRPSVQHWTIPLLNRHARHRSAPRLVRRD